MANQTGRPIAPARKLVAWIIGTIAFFVIALGLGMSSSPVAFFGVAVLGIAIAVAFMPAPRRGGRATVAGTAEVRSITPPPVAGAYGRATIGLIVVAPGLGAFETTVREPRIPVEKWPLPGATVPITVDVDDTRRVRVSWRDAPARLEGDDPPPPPAPAGRSEPDDLDDEVFGSVDEAPWEGREDDWDVDTDGPGPSSGPRGATTAYARRTGTPVVVRETAAGTIVEGQVVDTDEEPSVLPRRARPFPATDPVTAETVTVETATPEAETTQPASYPTETAHSATPAPPAVDPDEPPVPSARTAPGPDTEPDWSDPEPPWRTSAAGPSEPSTVREPETTARSATTAFVTSPQADPPPSAGPGPFSGARSPSASASGRPPGSRPSPRPRGATATFEREDPSSGTAEASPTSTVTTATQSSGTVPPAQRTSTESRAEPAIDIDLDLDGPPTRPVPPTATSTAGIPTQARPATPTEPTSPAAPGTPTAATAPTVSGASAAPTAPTDSAAPAAESASPGIPPSAAPEQTSATYATTETGPATAARSSGFADPVSPTPRAADPVSHTSRAADPVSPAGRRAGPIDPISPAGRSSGPAGPVSPAGRTTGPIDPISPAGRSTRGGVRIPGPTPPPPPAARRTDAPTPPPPPVARPSHAAAPPPPPARSTRPAAAPREQVTAPREQAAAPREQPTAPREQAAAPREQPTAPREQNAAPGEQNVWARPARSAPSPSPSPRPQPAPAPRSPASTDERWAGPSGPVSPAPQPTTGTASAGFAVDESGRTPAGPKPAGSAWAQPRPAAEDEDRWAPVSGSATVPPNVETRPLGSRTRFFAQPGEETESFETESGEPPAHTPQPRPEPTPSSASFTPSPVGPPPTAPAPDRPFPSAPPPATPRTSAPRPGIDQIDIPLDNFPLRGHIPPIDTNPEPAPEERPQTAAARADGIVAPPADDPGTPRPSALRDGILGVAVGRAAVSPDAFPTPHLDDAPDDLPAPGQERRGGPWGDFNGRPDEHAGDVITGYPSARPAGSIHGVGITVLVTDLDRSTEFYRDVLGFHEIDNGDGSAVLASGDTRLVLRTVHNLSADAGRLIYLNLEVGDIEAVHAELREKGVKFIHSPRPVNRGDKLELWSATFRDPDNHNIAITQWRAIH